MSATAPRSSTPRAGRSPTCSACRIQYRERFSDFLKGVDGDTGEEAFRWVYGKTLDQVESDFKRYVVQKRLPATVYEIRLNKSVEKPTVRPATATEVSLVKAGLLVGLDRRDQALEIYRDLARQDPGDWRIPEALGYLASYSGDEASARRHFARAVELEAANPRLYYDFALLLQEGRCRTRSHQAGVAQGDRSGAGLR